jgi:hypothetical protein
VRATRIQMHCIVQCSNIHKLILCSFTWCSTSTHTSRTRAEVHCRLQWHTCAWRLVASCAWLCARRSFSSSSSASRAFWLVRRASLDASRYLPCTSGHTCCPQRTRLEHAPVQTQQSTVVDASSHSSHAQWHLRDTWKLADRQLYTSNAGVSTLSSTRVCNRQVLPIGTQTLIECALSRFCAASHLRLHLRRRHGVHMLPLGLHGVPWWCSAGSCTIEAWIIITSIACTPQPAFLSQLHTDDENLLTQRNPASVERTGKGPQIK